MRRRSGQPSQERIAGAQRAVRAAHERVQAHVAEHLTELVAGLEAQGAEAAADLDRAAGMVLDAFARRTRIDGEISALVALIGGPSPGDVSRSLAEPVAAECHRLLDGGGEPAPRLKVDPRHPDELLPVAETMTAA